MAEDLADDLYGLPLEEFVPSRDARARELRREKRRAEAKAVAALVKPSRPAWIVNRLAREETALVAKLLECAEALEEAQQAALFGERAPDLRAASRAERKAVDQLLAAARGLRPEGHKASDAILERVRVTLQATAGDPKLRERIRAGRVVEEPAGGGAWPFGGLTEEAGETAPAVRSGRARREKPATGKRDGAAAAPRSRRAPSRRDQERPEDEEDAARTERNRAAEREEQQRADEERAARRRELQGELTRARKAARDAARERERARRDADRATERLERLAAEAAAARDAVESATARREAAEAEADAAEADVARIEDELRGR